MSLDFGGRGGAPGTPLQGELGEEVFSTFDPRVLRRFFAYLRPYRGPLASALAAVALYVAAQLGIPLAIKAAVDAAVGPGGGAAGAALAAFAVLVAVNAVAAFCQEWTAARLAQRVIFDLRRAMYAHLQDVPVAFLQRTQVGRLMSRLQGDINALQEFLETSINGVGDLFLLAGIVVVLLAMDWRLGLLTLLVLPLLTAARAAWLPIATPAFRHARDAASIVNGALAENIGGVRTVLASRREALNFERFAALAEASYRVQTRAALVAQAMVPVVEVLTGLALAAVVVVGGAAVSGKRMEVGAMVAFIFYVQRFIDPIRTLSVQYTVMQRAMAAGSRIFELLDVPLPPYRPRTPVGLGEQPPSLEFRDVVFGYAPQRPVLHHIDFRIEPYQNVALVGATGSGKSSIAALARRFHDVWQGQVRVGGYDVREVSRDSLGRYVGLVLQEPFLFTGTVLENIRYASAAGREQVIEAARAVGAHGFISALPQGYDTPMAQRGQNLSLGQRQLISFARTLVADPRLLILDEATASIDSFTEQQLQAALEMLLRGRTSLVIAHRLSTIRNADRILVLDGGRLAESGCHPELMARGGLYAELHARNFDLPEAAHAHDAVRTPHPQQAPG
ncbi:MAG: ABC transporter ATP-binding protein [Pseudoxanthomonas sp.]